MTSSSSSFSDVGDDQLQPPFNSSRRLPDTVTQQKKPSVHLIPSTPRKISHYQTSRRSQPSIHRRFDVRLKIRTSRN